MLCKYHERSPPVHAWLVKRKAEEEQVVSGRIQSASFLETGEVSK